MLVLFLTLCKLVTGAGREGLIIWSSQRIGEAEVVATVKSMREAMNKEVRLTLDVHERHVWTNIGKVYSWWENLSKEACVILENKPRLTISFDMGWQQRSSGNKYNLNSGHAICIGGYSKKILDYCIKSKVCNIGSDLNISLKHWYVYMMYGAGLGHITGVYQGLLSPWLVFNCFTQPALL
jgi:hypothetical protein